MRTTQGFGIETTCHYGETGRKTMQGETRRTECSIARMNNYGKDYIRNFCDRGSRVWKGMVANALKQGTSYSSSSSSSSLSLSSSSSSLSLSLSSSSLSLSSSSSSSLYHHHHHHHYHHHHHHHQRRGFICARFFRIIQSS